MDSLIRDTPQGTKDATRIKVSSLFHMCLKFVACNIEFVDSLSGFPDLLGEQIFNSVQTGRQLSLQSENTSKIIILFSEAYKDLVLESLDLKHCSFVLQSIFTLIQCCFHSLKHLDLHGCRIGDNHEMLEFISNSNSLEYVGLCHNALTDKGLQKLTAPLRIMRNGLKSLSILDLSCNVSLSDHCIRYIKSLPELKELDVSGTKITENGVELLKSSAGLDLVHEMSSTLLSRGAATKGWAKDVVHNWISEANQLHAAQKTELSAAEKFYSRRKQMLHLASELTSKQKTLDRTPPRKPVLILRSSQSTSESAPSTASPANSTGINLICDNKGNTTLNPTYGNRSARKKFFKKTSQQKLVTSTQSAIDMIFNDDTDDERDNTKVDQVKISETTTDKEQQLLNSYITQYSS